MLNNRTGTYIKFIKIIEILKEVSNIDTFFGALKEKKIRNKEKKKANFK